MLFPGSGFALLHKSFRSVVVYRQRAIIRCLQIAALSPSSFHCRTTAIFGAGRKTSKARGAVKLTPLSGYVGYALRRAQSTIFADFNHTLRGLNLRPGQFAVLVLIDQNPGASQSSVSAALGIQKANFVATIADLEARGLVRRRKSDLDGRTYSLGLTSRGRTLLQHAAELQSLHEQRVIAHIGFEGRNRLLTLLERLAELPCEPVK
jgi:DNA-binding MarR family transcriptional regulator